MAYLSLGLARRRRARTSLAERIHWERLAVLVVDLALWALILRMFF
jgi:hypothetical protein